MSPIATHSEERASVVAVPRHVAIIMDGNGRWAKAREMKRSEGHKRGAETLRAVMKACPHLGIEYLTVYAFSSENWRRPVTEVSDLMHLLSYYLQSEISTLQENNIRLKVIGERARLPGIVRSQIEKAERETLQCSGFQLTVCLSYGARQEIVQAVRAIAAEVAKGQLSPEMIDEALLERMLYTQALPPPDLMIRTGGEHRLSNFLLWQSAYSELYFTPTLWPDFSEEDLRQACLEYSRRERRYGRTNDDQ